MMMITKSIWCGDQFTILFALIEDRRGGENNSSIVQSGFRIRNALDEGVAITNMRCVTICTIFLYTQMREGIRRCADFEPMYTYQLLVVYPEIRNYT